MALSSATIAYDISDKVGADFDARRTKVWVSTNIPGEVIADTVGNQIRVGDGLGDIADDGTGSVSVWVPGTGSNPATWQTYIHFDYAQRRPGGSRVQETFGPFTITADANLADLIAEQAIPPTYLSEVTTALQSFVDDAESAETSAQLAQTAAEAARDAAVSISGISTSDGVVGALVAGTGGAGPLTRAAVSASVAAGASSAMQETLARIRTATRDVNILVVGDSTAAGSTDGSWVDTTVTGLAALFPTHSISYRKWVTGTSSYAAATVTPGTGSRTINVWNGSLAGQTWQYAIDSTRRTALAITPNPDLIFFCHGHNESNTDAATDAGVDGKLRDRMVAAVETIRSQLPAAAVVLVSQNPLGDWAGNSERRADMYRRAARERGWGFIDVTRAFYDDGRTIPGVLVNVDKVHPTAAGYAVWGAAVLNAFRTSTPAQPITTQPAALGLGRLNLATNGFFEDFGTPPTLPGWSASNATLSKNTTNVETKAYSVKIAKTAAGSASYIETTLAVPKLIVGRDITVAVRMYVVTGQPGTTGQLAVTDGTSKSSALWSLRDQWHWQTLTVSVAPGATTVTVRVYAEASSAATLSEISVDRVVVVPGRVPMDFYPASLTEAMDRAGRLTVGGTGVLTRFSNTFNLSESDSLPGVFVGRDLGDSLKPYLVLSNGTDAHRAIIDQRSGFLRSQVNGNIVQSIGSNTIGYFGATPVGRRTLGAAATDAASTQTLANNLRQALIDLGLGQT